MRMHLETHIAPPELEGVAVRAVVLEGGSGSLPAPWSAFEGMPAFGISRAVRNEERRRWRCLSSIWCP